MRFSAASLLFHALIMLFSIIILFPELKQLFYSTFQALILSFEHSQFLTFNFRIFS